MSFSIPSGNDLLSFAPDTIEESTYYDSLILDNRAKITVVDEKGKPGKVPKGMSGVNTLILAYNPAELTVSRTLDWSTIKTNGQKSQQSYGGGGEDTMSVPVLLDASEWDAAGTQGGSLIQHLKLLHYLASPFEAEAGQTITPPLVKFEWGKMSFIGVITKIGTKIEMFNGEGDPMRAVVTLDLKGVFLPESPEEGALATIGALDKPQGAAGGSESDLEEG